MKGHTVHKYQRFKSKKDNPIFKCMLDNCPHYLPQDFLVLGRRTICWGCGLEFLMTRDKIHVNKPKCDGCIERRREDMKRLAELPVVD